MYQRAEAEALTKLTKSSAPSIPRLIYNGQSTKGLLTNVVQPLCHRRTQHPMTSTQFNELVDGMKMAHEAGYCCRDVRPKNIMISDGHLYHIDWNCSVEVGKAAQYQGTLRYASNRVLQAMIDTKSLNPMITFEPADDLVSLVRVVSIEAIPCSLNSSMEPSAAELLQIWKSRTVFSKATAAAERCDYETLKKEVNDFLSNFFL
eukprot:m.191322 g.191322  ORF g.191322 m.191322 type:complete len:204 (-) comp10047_c0_seq1:128-739(-)